MATVNIVRTRIGAGVAVAAAAYIDQQNITSSGTSQATTNAADGDDQFWVVKVSGGDVYMAAGTSPTAVSGTGWLIKDGERLEFAASPSQKLAVIDA